MRTKQLREKRAAIYEQVKGVLDKAVTEARSLTSEEQESITRMEAEMEGLKRTYEAIERSEATEAELNRSQRENGHRPAPGVERHGSASPTGTDEYRDAFWSGVRNRFNGPEVRALQVGDDAEGGYLVPDSFEKQLITNLGAAVAMRRLANVISTASKLNIPTVTTKPSFAYMAEEATYGVTAPAFGLKSIGAHKAGGIILVSDELLQDSVFNLPGFISDQFVEAGAELEESKFCGGSGTAEPRGFLLDAETGKTGASATDVTYDELLDVVYSLKPGYRMKATWLMKDSTALVLRKKKGGDGQYIWQPGVIAGEPDRLFNRPVEYSDSMPALGAGLKPIAFGDFKQYRIVDRLGIQMMRLNELYAATGQVGFRVTFRNDGKLLKNEAIKLFVNA